MVATAIYSVSMVLWKETAFLFAEPWKAVINIIILCNRTQSTVKIKAKVYTTTNAHACSIYKFNAKNVVAIDR